MRILVLHNSYARRGGEDEVVERESALLAAGGEDVRVSIVPNVDFEDPLRAARIAARLPFSEPSLRRMSRLLEETAPDLVHLHNYFPVLTPSVLDACVDAGVPVVHTLHNYRYFCANGVMLRRGSPCQLCLHGSPLHAVAGACYRGSRPGTLAVVRMIARQRRRHTWGNKVHRFIAPSAFSKEVLSSAGLPADRIVVKPHFADDPTEYPARSRRDYALFVGRLSVEKGIASLLKAWRTVPHELRVMGDGPLRGLVQSAAAENRRVTFLGPSDREGVDAALRGAAYLVFPSVLPETFGMTIIEAYAHGTPVLVSRLGGQAELVREGVTGLLYQAGDPADMIAKATALWEDEGGRRRMGEAARAEYEEKYTAARNLQLLRGVFEDVLGSSAKPATRAPAG